MDGCKYYPLGEQWWRAGAELEHLWPHISRESFSLVFGALFQVRMREEIDKIKFENAKPVPY